MPIWKIIQLDLMFSLDLNVLAGEIENLEVLFSIGRNKVRTDVPKLHHNFQKSNSLGN